MKHWRERLEKQPVLWELAGTAGLLLLLYFAYGRLLNGYFATDEWWAFSYAIAHPHWPDLFKPEGVYAPSANLFISFLYHTFGLNALVWATLALVLHGFNTLLVYWLTLRLSGHRLIAFASAAFFTVLPMGSQFLHQFSMMPTSGMATTFALASLVAYSYRRVILAAFLLLAGLSFSPYVVPFAFLAVVLELSLLKREAIRSSFLRVACIAAALVGYLILIHELSLKFGGFHDRPVAGQSSAVSRLLSIGQKIYQSYGELYANLPGNIDQALMIKYSTVVIVASIAGIGLLCWRKQYRLAQTALVGLLWIPISVSLFSTLNTVALDATFPSRYFYVTTIGVGLLLGSFCIGIFSVKRLPVGEILLIGLLAWQITAQLPVTQKVVNNEVKLGQQRKAIMDTIESQVPKKLGRDVLFCFNSTTGYYSTAPDVIPLPFVHNFAFNLAVLYRSDVPALREFFQNNGYFLNPAANFYYFTRDQRDPNGLGPGIGFATSVDHCKDLKDRFALNLRLEDVYGFAYDGNTLTDITDPLRQYLAGNDSARPQLSPWLH